MALFILDLLHFCSQAWFQGSRVRRWRQASATEARRRSRLVVASTAFRRCSRVQRFEPAYRQAHGFSSTYSIINYSTAATPRRIIGPRILGSHSNQVTIRHLLYHHPFKSGRRRRPCPEPRCSALPSRNTQIT
jgi:hypothetical protein